MPVMRYAYDPLDRLIASLSGSQASSRRHFYNHERLSTRVQSEHSQSVFQHQHLVLAEKRTTGTQLLATDAKRSVLHGLSGSGNHAQAYSAYGHPRLQSGQQSLLGFNGEACDPLTGHYLLGNGHRGYNPVLMRFNSPDALSPFGKGGINAYAYCAGDPVNRSDPSGRFSMALASAIIGFAGALLSTQRSMGFMGAMRKILHLQPSLRAVTKVATTSGTVLASGVTLTRLVWMEWAPTSVPTQLLGAATVLSGVSVAGAAVGAALYRLKKGPFIWNKKKLSAAGKENFDLTEVVSAHQPESPQPQSSSLSTQISHPSSQNPSATAQATDIRKK
ncbi:hypothetical protein AQS70_10670 [Pseudomonas endophytica]|uniref:Teneurin-like YD-shell domain-containing protein n=1 Tax=Pseudomonas endophytica TaxID=1563157 RepID=A0A0Q1CFI3_9PSED|nr:RHS repeat-associated core domain-containing protein [Pseudomonas endophytica]KQB53361.1 hypothetical protein AQS70_10670 [Pseudomonas endophytica]